LIIIYITIIHSQIENIERISSEIEKLLAHSAENGDIFAAFEWEVDSQTFPHYYCTIPVPMYIDLIRRRLNNKYYRHIEALEFDIDLIYKNCAFFNAEGTSIVADANELVIQMKRIIFDGIYVEGIIFIIVFLFLSIIIIIGTAENSNHLTSQSSSSSMHEPTDESRNAKKRQSDDDHYGEVENDAKPKRSRNIRFTYDDSESKAQPVQQDESSNLRLTLRRNATSSQDEISGRRSSRSSSEKRKSYSEVYSDEDDNGNDDDDDDDGNDRYARNTRTSSRTTVSTGGISLRKRNNVNYNEDEAFEQMNGHSARNTRTRNSSRRYNYDDDDDDDEEDDHGDDDDERDERPVRSSRRVVENKENNDHTNAHVNSSRSSRTVAAASSR